jgi:hypothetical protein
MLMALFTTLKFTPLTERVVKGLSWKSRVEDKFPRPAALDVRRSVQESQLGIDDISKFVGIHRGVSVQVKKLSGIGISSDFPSVFTFVT